MLKKLQDHFILHWTSFFKEFSNLVKTFLKIELGLLIVYAIIVGLFAKLSFDQTVSSLKDIAFGDIVLKKEQLESEFSRLNSQINSFLGPIDKGFLKALNISIKNDCPKEKQIFLNDNGLKIYFKKDGESCFTQFFLKDELLRKFKKISGISKGFYALAIKAPSNKWVIWEGDSKVQWDWVNHNILEYTINHQSYQMHSKLGILTVDDTGIEHRGESINNLLILSFIPDSIVKKETEKVLWPIWRFSLFYLILSFIASILFSYFLENRKKLLDNLKVEQMKLINQSKLASLGEMAAGIAHEINNPLTIISFNAQILLTTEINEDQKGLLVVIKDTAHRAAKIVKGMKNVSRNSDNDPMIINKIDSILSETLLLCEDKIKKGQIDIEIKFDDKDIEIFGKATQISQIFLNLISNACDAMENSPVKSLAVKVKQVDDQCLVSITDTGPGIPKNLLDKIFQPFFSTKGPGKGTGLGLSIVHTIIKEHKGTIELVSDPSGSTFNIKIPRRKRD